VLSRPTTRVLKCLRIISRLYAPLLNPNLVELGLLFNMVRLFNIHLHVAKTFWRATIPTLWSIRHYDGLRHILISGIDINGDLPALLVVFQSLIFFFDVTTLVVEFSFHISKNIK